MAYPVVVIPFLNVDAMALFPFILVKRAAFKHDKVLIRHETIHLQQAAELLIVPFYILYLLNYLVNRFKYANHYKAYYEIIFEREAYHNECDKSYLKNRKLWAWRFYFSNEVH
jgi:hypothetical protein